MTVKSKPIKVITQYIYIDILSNSGWFSIEIRWRSGVRNGRKLQSETILRMWVWNHSKISSDPVSLMIDDGSLCLHIPRLVQPQNFVMFTALWSVLGHILSEEQSLDGSNGVSNDGHLTIVQCHLYHQPPLLHLYRTSVGIRPYSDTTNKICILIIVITNQHHVLSTTAQPKPHHAPHMFHDSGQSHHTHTSSRGHGFWSPQGLVRIWVSTLWHPLEYKSFHYMFILLPYAFQVNSLYVHVSPLYKYSSLLYVFR